MRCHTICNTILVVLMVLPSALAGGTMYIDLAQSVRECESAAEAEMFSTAFKGIIVSTLVGSGQGWELTAATENACVMSLESTAVVTFIFKAEGKALYMTSVWYSRADIGEAQRSLMAKLGGE